jgi:hypothetical protein
MKELKIFTALLAFAFLSYMMEQGYFIEKKAIEMNINHPELLVADEQPTDSGQHPIYNVYFASNEDLAKTCPEKLKSNIFKLNILDFGSIILERKNTVIKPVYALISR